MAPSEHANLRIIQAAVDRPIDLAGAVSSPAWRGGASALKRDARCTVLVGEAPAGFQGGRLVVKTWWLRPKDRLAGAFGGTQAMRHWKAAAFLRERGVATARCLALFRRAGEETLVMRESPGRTLLQHMDDARRGRSPISRARRAALAGAVGAQVSALAHLGVFNRDHKPSNLIVRERDDGGFDIVMIDVVGLRKDRLRIGGSRMLVSLMLEPMGVGCAPGRTMRMRTLIGATGGPGGASLIARKSAWRAIAQAIDEHGDPTPKINPLAPPQQA